MNGDQAKRWLSEPRWNRFLTAAGGDEATALALCAWHAEMTRECFGVVHGFEVILRNAIDTKLGAGQPQAPLEETWLLSFNVLTYTSMSTVLATVARLKPEKRTRGGVVAALMFGFWRDLFTKGYDELWRHELRDVFPHASPLRRRDVGRRLEGIRLFRNRIAHHDSLLSTDIVQLLNDMETIVAWIDPDAAAWLRASTEAHATVLRRPR